MLKHHDFQMVGLQINKMHLIEVVGGGTQFQWVEIKPLQRGDRHYTSESGVCRRQNLASVDVRI